MKQVTKTHLAHGIEKTENLSRYDDSIKVLLSDKQVLARIAQHRIEEFRDYDIPMIIPLKRKMYMVHQWMVENMIIFRYHLFVSQKGVWKKARIS